LKKGKITENHSTRVSLSKRKCQIALRMIVTLPLKVGVTFAKIQFYHISRSPKVGVTRKISLLKALLEEAFRVLNSLNLAEFPQKLYGISIKIAHMWKAHT